VLDICRTSNSYHKIEMIKVYRLLYKKDLKIVMNAYCGFISERVKKVDTIDQVTLDEIVVTSNMHPKAVFPYTHRNTTTDASIRKYFTYIYMTESLTGIVEHARSTGIEPQFPDTRFIIDNNTIERLAMYQEALTKFPDMTYEKLGISLDGEHTETPPEILKIIVDFFTKPHTPEIVDLFRFFTTFDDVIRYLNGGVLYDRESAYTKVMSRPLNTLILRNSSMGKYNIKEEQFFAATVNEVTTDVVNNHWLFCHRKGYGIFQAGNYVDTTFAGTKFVETEITKYYTCIGDLILRFVEAGHKMYNQHEYNAFVGYTS
jgi:hypothetical protein